MLVSIAISTYEANGHGASFTRKLLESIVMQTYRPLEIVIADHSLDDAVAAVVRDAVNAVNAVEVNIRYIHNPNDRGSSSANTNLAIDSCTGDIIKILFGDDYFSHPNAITQIVNAFNTHPESVWLVTGCNHTKDGNNVYRPHIPKLNPNLCIGNNTVGCPSVVAIRSSVRERFDTSLKWLMDTEMYHRLLLTHGKPIIINNELVTIRQHPNQVTHLCDPSLVAREKAYVKNKHGLR